MRSTRSPRLLLLLGLLLGWSLFPSLSQAQPSPPDRPQNVILLITDGYGPSSVTMGRDYLRALEGTRSLAMDSVLVGSVRTFATNSRITDSAAGATAFSAHTKTYNGAIAVDTLRRPVATLLEAAERRGMATGLVATSRITHATPAAFSAHVVDRDFENAIAAQQLAHDIEVILGGGRRHFLPEAEGGERTDGRHLVRAARDQGYRYVTNAQQLSAITQTPVLGLFSPSHMAYEIDRAGTGQPSLTAMATKAIALLRQDEDGFFLMIEASRIDHAGHANDAAAQVHDVLAYNDAAAAVLDAARQMGNTLVVAVSDHATGGLSLGRNIDGQGVYAWKPRALARVQASHGALLTAMRTAAAQGNDAIAVFRQQTGIKTLTDDEIARLRALLDDPGSLNDTISDIIGRRAIVGWTTSGHTAVDVNLYAYGPGAARFRGNHDNTYVGQALAELLAFNLAALTPVIRQQFDPTPAAAATN